MRKRERKRVKESEKKTRNKFKFTLIKRESESHNLKQWSHETSTVSKSTLPHFHIQPKTNINNNNKDNKTAKEKVWVIILQVILIALLL